MKQYIIILICLLLFSCKIVKQDANIERKYYYSNVEYLYYYEPDGMLKIERETIFLLSRDTVAIWMQHQARGAYKKGFEVIKYTTSENRSVYLINKYEIVLNKSDIFVYYYLQSGAKELRQSWHNVREINLNQYKN